MWFIGLLALLWLGFVFIGPGLKDKLGPWLGRRQEQQQAENFKKEYRDHPERF